MSELNEKQIIFKMMLDAYDKTRQATEIYEQLSKLVGQGTVQAFLIDIIFEDNKLKYKQADEAYRKNKDTMDQKQRQLINLYNTTAMGISRAKKADAALIDMELYLFMEFKMDKEAVNKKVDEVKATTSVAKIPAKVEEIVKGKETARTASNVETSATKVATVVQIQAFVERASEELIIKALIEKAKKKGATALTQALEMILPLAMVTIPVASKVETVAPNTVSPSLLSMWK